MRKSNLPKVTMLLMLLTGRAEFEPRLLDSRTSSQSPKLFCLANQSVVQPYLAKREKRKGPSCNHDLPTVRDIFHLLDVSAEAITRGGKNFGKAQTEVNLQSELAVP